MTGAISSLSSFRIIDLIPSGPGALSGLRFESSLRIPFSCIGIFQVYEQKSSLEVYLCIID